MSAAAIQKQYATKAEVDQTSPEGVHVVLIKYDDDTWAIKTATVPNHFNLKHTEPTLTEALLTWIFAVPEVGADTRQAA